MSDAISNAIEITKRNAAGLATSVASNASSAVTAAVASAIPPSVSDKLKKLPTTKDPELLKAQAKAEAQKIKGELQNKVEQEKEKKIEELKDKVASFIPPAIAGAAGLFLKLPILDPKLLAMLAYLKAQQELREAKQKLSKQNLKKAKENFTFPMKPPTRLSGIPKIPEIPKLPELPKLPPIPKLPTSLRT